jgi:D-sedoheptulose 7-phosphate isomerase
MKKLIMQTLADHRRMLETLQQDGITTIENAAKLIIQCFKNGGTVYICGNGGSAADAQHIAAELVGRFLKNRKALPAIALSTDTSVLTAVANDTGFDKIFVRQVEALVKKGDCLLAISTSGKSPNVVAPAKLAKKRKAKILAFTGKTNSPLEKIADICFCAPNEKTFAVQEMHQVAYHIICDLVERHFA